MSQVEAGRERQYFFEHGGEMTPIGAAEVKIGSGADCDVVVAGDKVEALTAVARRAGDQVVLESRANENEARVNGRMLSLAELAPGGRLKVGDLEFEVTGEGASLVLEGDAGSFPLKIGANLVGRAPEASVLVDHPSVSRKHALVMVMPGGQARIRDLGSSNGTEVGGERLGVAELKHGDRVEVGDEKLIFLAGPEPQAADGAGAGVDDKTMAKPISVAPQGGGGGPAVAPTVIGASLDLPERTEPAPAADEPPAPSFELVRDGAPPKQLRPGTTVIGREPECDVSLVDDDQVSRRHAEITISGPDAKLKDLGSSNGTRLNGRPLTGEAVLADGDVISIGHAEMEIKIARPVDPRGATVLAPGGLPIPSAPGRGGAAAGAGVAGAGAGRGAGSGGLIVDRASARAILDLPPGATPEQIRQRYQELYSEYQIRVTNAPTPDLKERYGRRLEELRSAHAILMPDDAGLSGDLPASRPVDAPLPGPAGATKPGAGSVAAAGAAAAAAGAAATPPSPVPAPAGAGAAESKAERKAREKAAAKAAKAEAKAAKAAAAGAAAKAGTEGGGVPRSTWIMAAVVLVLLAAIGVFTWLYLGAAKVEAGVRDDLAQRETDLANMRERIPQAGRELEDLVAGKASQLENHELKICNLGAGEMRIDWLHATYVTEDGAFDSFDSAQHGWKTWQVAPGGSGKFGFVSGDRVLWDGTAVFFSVLFTYRGEEYFRSGPLTELGPDCYNIDLDQ